MVAKLTFEQPHKQNLNNISIIDNTITLSLSRFDFILYFILSIVNISQIYKFKKCFNQIVKNLYLKRSVERV